MSSSIANSRLSAGLLPLAVLVAAVWLLRPLENRPGTAEVPSIQLRELGGNGVLGVLGGMRAAVASGFWLRTNRAWERRDSRKPWLC